MDHVKHIELSRKIAERCQNSGCSGRENIVEFYQDVQVDFDRMGPVHEPLSINLAQAFSEGLLCPAPSFFVARTAMGVLDGLNFLHNEMHLVYAGRLFLFASFVRQRTETHLRAPATLSPFCRIGDAKHSLSSEGLARRGRLELYAASVWPSGWKSSLNRALHRECNRSLGGIRTM
jgi:hypothetical protein